MLLYSLKCKKGTESLYPKFSKIKIGKTVLLSKGAAVIVKKSRFIKK